MFRPLPLFALLALPALGWWAYSPGLHGGFVFDDFNNLGQLGAYGRVNNFRSLALYLTSGNADPIGRPLALLSFLIDADNWPADPEPFKRTGILLHLLNGLLLASLLLRLGRKLRLDEGRARAGAWLGAAVWTFHPFLVSTTLYVVQREAMLPASFTLLGALLWLAGRDRFAQGRRGGLPLLLAAAVGCTLLATLCKANGMLLPLLLLVMEWILLQPGDATMDSSRGRSFNRIRLVLLALPSAIVAAWLLSLTPALFSPGNTGSRAWSMAQRFITEPRVLCDYLRQLWLPRASGASVFNDGFRVSTDLLHPWTTLPALVIIVALLAAGFALRRRHPAAAFAILFFFAGHVLESTWVPLELYFEHRNYLPALPIFWPLALWLTAPGRLRLPRLAVATILPLLLLLLCHERATIWGKPYEQALLLAQIDTDSPRAQANAAAYEASVGRPDLAVKRLQLALAKMPDEAQLAINLVDAECAAGGVLPASLEQTQSALAGNHEQAELVQHWLVGAIAKAADNSCRGLDFPAVGGLIAAMRRNPHYSKAAGHQHDIQELDGRMALAQGDGAGALRAFDADERIYATPDGALLQAALLGSAGFPALGVEHLEYYKTLQPADRGFRGMPAIHAWLLQKLGYWSSEFDHLEGQLREDAEQTPAATVKLPTADTAARP
jgi:hypothetical protein